MAALTVGIKEKTLDSGEKYQIKIIRVVQGNQNYGIYKHLSGGGSPRQEYSISQGSYDFEGYTDA